MQNNFMSENIKVKCVYCELKLRNNSSSGNKAELMYWIYWIYWIYYLLNIKKLL